MRVDRGSRPRRLAREVFWCLWDSRNFISVREEEAVFLLLCVSSRERRSILFQEFSVVWWWKCKNEIGGILEGCVRMCVSGSMCASFTYLLLLGLQHFCPWQFVHVMVSACARSWACLHLISLSSWIYVLYMFAAPSTVIRHPHARHDCWYFLSELLPGSGWNELKE